MGAFVLAIRPGRIVGYAAVQGSYVYDAGSLFLLHEVKTTGRRAMPPAELGSLMERRLATFVEQLASTFDALDAIVIASSIPQSGGVDTEALAAAAERGALLAKTWHRTVPVDAWRTMQGYGHEPVDAVAAAQEAVDASRGSKAQVSDVETAEAVMMGLHASRHLGIPVLAAMPDEGPPD